MFSISDLLCKKRSNSSKMTLQNFLKKLKKSQENEKRVSSSILHCIIFIEKYANLFSICNLCPYPNYIYAYCFVLFNTNGLSEADRNWCLHIKYHNPEQTRQHHQSITYIEDIKH